VIDQVLTVNEDEALESAQRLARSDGILAGFSAGAALAAALRLARQPELEKKRVVVVLPDTGERYVSTPLFRSIAS
jgi:cysteine synthase A